MGEALKRKINKHTVFKCYGPKVNELIARSEEELEVFNQMDEEIEEYDWVELLQDEKMPLFLKDPPKSGSLKIVLPRKRKRTESAKSIDNRSKKARLDVLDDLIKQDDARKLKKQQASGKPL